MKRLHRIEKICIGGIIVFGLVIVLALIWLVRSPGEKVNPVADQATLAVPEDYLPQKLTLGETPAAVTFTDVEGNAVSLKNRSGTPLLLVFWSRWCQNCEKQMEIAPQIAKTAAQYGAKVLLIYKFDPDNETREEVRNSFANFAGTADITLLYDEAHAAYDAWGVRCLPTLIALDARGCVAAFEAGERTGGEIAGLLDLALYGGARGTAQFIAASMTNDDGGVMMNVRDALGVPGGHDVLSESQGILMEYALLAGNHALFDAAYDYVKEFMLTDGLAAWYVTKEAEKAGSNAVIDDLRIWSALVEADSMWGGYAADEKAMRDAIYENCVRGEQIVDFYEFSSGKTGDTLSLHSADIAALRALTKEDPRFEQVLRGAQAILEGGYISDEFPLYYASYDYAAGIYSQNDLNISEALYVLLHLAKVDLLPETSLNWLRAQVAGEGLAACYRVDGSVVKGYSYHSTAPYALAALIALAVDDRALYTDSVDKMQRYRIDDAESDWYGGFGDSESGDFPAFDQLIPLLAYASDPQNATR